MKPVPPVTARATRMERSALSLPVQVNTTFEILARHRPEKALRIRINKVVQIARVRVQDSELLGDGIDHGRMAMSEGRHIVVGIEQTSVSGAVEPHTLGPHDMQRALIEEHRRGTERPLPAHHEQFHLSRKPGRIAHVESVQLQNFSSSSSFGSPVRAAVGRHAPYRDRTGAVLTETGESCSTRPGQVLARAGQGCVAPSPLE